MRFALDAQRNCGCTTNCGYKCVHVSDPHAKHWLADDSNFLASLNDLDQGLSEGGRGSDEVDDAAAAPPPAASPAALTPPRSAAGRPARPINVARALDPARVLDTAPPPLALARPLTAEPRTRRPLLDLFPPSALEPEGPPLPAFGTAVGPQLGRPPRRADPVAREPDTPSPIAAVTHETFYGLREKPFSLSTDPRFQYQSASHERAGQEILAAVRKRGGPALLTAPLGMGKTTLCRGLLLAFDRRTVTSLVLEPMRSLDDLVTTLLVDFGVMSREEVAGAAHVSRQTLVATLNTFLESLVPLQASAVVFIDEAQNLPRALLGDLADWLGGSPAGVVQLVLVGQPALTALLQHSDLRALNASVAWRSELGPLAADEISSYVMHRLTIAGAHTRIVFDETAMARLFALSSGLPRTVNLLCDRALTRGQAASAGVIDGALIGAAASDLGFGSTTERPDLLRSLLLVGAFALLVLVGAAGALWTSRDAVSRTIQQWQNVPLPPGGPVRRLPLPLAPIPPPRDAPAV